MLRHVSWLARRYAQVADRVNYLQKRRELMDDPTYQQQAKRQEAHLPPSPTPSTPKPTHQKTGSTEAKYRWGRQTFSARLLK